jgi:HEAT repeat protein
MALVKGKAPGSDGKAGRNAVPDRGQLEAALEDADAAVRRHAARQIAGCPHAAAPLIGRLKREQDAAVREAILHALLRLNDPSVAVGLAECLRSEDAALRNEAIEAMKRLGSDRAPLLRSLLGDPDPDVRIFAVNILDSERYPEVENWLIEVIERDPHVNVCATAADVLCEVGTEAAIDPLLRLQARFASEAYIQFAASLALKRIREI